MNHKEFETVGFELPLISPKTPYGQLKVFSEQRWLSGSRRRVAADMVMNGKELLMRSNIDWDLVLDRIHVQHGSTLQSGEAALAVYDATMVGGIAVVGEWAMHNPPIVYLSVKRLANGARLKDFKSTAQEAAVVYGHNVLRNAKLYMATLDFLLEVRDRNKYRHILRQVASLLGMGDIEEAYKIVSSRGDLVRRRGEDSSSDTTSSILTPPKSGM